MPQKKLKKLIAGYSLTGLLTTTLCCVGCSDKKQQNVEVGKQKTPSQQVLDVDKEAENSFAPAGKETKIRGTSG